MNRKRTIITTCTGVILLLGVWAWFKLPLWRDTIIRTDVDAVLVLPSGKEYRTNRWFLRDDTFQFSRLQIQTDNGTKLIHYIVQSYDEDAKAKLRIGDTEFFAIMDGSRWKSTSNKAEYFVSPDRQSKKSNRVPGSD